MSIPEFFTAPLITTYIYLTNTGTKILSSLLCRFSEPPLQICQEFERKNFRTKKFTLPFPLKFCQEFERIYFEFCRKYKNGGDLSRPPPQ